MSYSFIKSAQKKLIQLEDRCLDWKERVSRNIFTLTRTNSSEGQKKKTYDSLLKFTSLISEEARGILDELKEVRFSESQSFLKEEKKHLIQKYEKLIVELHKIKEIISQQVKRKTTIITPLQRKIAKKGYCYFCDVSIADDFAYKLEKEEQKTFGVEITEGALFCSRKCLWNYCDEYKNREKARQEERGKIREKIEGSKKLVTKLQEQSSELTDRINELERREKELELSPENYHIEKQDNVGFFRRLGQKLGLVKKPSSLSRLERVRILKEKLSNQLKKKDEELKESLIILSLEEQEGKRIEEKLLLGKEKSGINEITSNEEEEFEE